LQAMAGIYLHIPYCKQACSYCNFHFSTSTKGREELIVAMKKELTLRKNYLQNDTVETIYFGGGTPSILGIGVIQDFIEIILRIFPKTNIKELTLEANPDDLNLNTIKAIAQ